MGDQLEARINVVEYIQEEFGHEIQEIKKELVRLTMLIENHTEAKVVYSQDFCPLRLSHALVFASIQVHNQASRSQQ